MHTIVSLCVIASGLLLAAVLGATTEVRIYGVILVGIGVLALLAQAWLGRQRTDRGPPGRR